MRAVVITLEGHGYSEACAARCMGSAAQVGILVEHFGATGKDAARQAMMDRGLTWTWPTTAETVCPRTGLKLKPYRTKDLRARIGCAMSHYRLWQEAVATDERLLILEHDAVFLRGLPRLPDEFHAVMLNDPAGATPQGDYWRTVMKARGNGVFRKTEIFQDGRPDGLAGNSAYVISPAGAALAIETVNRCGLWPNDATLCRQLVPELFEVFPFVTRAEQTVSTSGGY